ncbi:hypothetical protein DC3_13210 [Deinococcus cellulosilyticus NBRC 106333 = KACC 11606]|uniref:Uncharacterized protein n=1 Tax=Deinococcus cellulosilyticus (strain DSM 18568 / NBRC 106333 / KACC 11606 / 5516J-15) TaxID=1223518 RepID=A0A511MZX8_DEIC1|nr:hypothetical protein DC3_13210 [Deinococcus cellulosilyticus NBRC 106333 = KACC 11606]
MSPVLKNHPNISHEKVMKAMDSPGHLLNLDVRNFRSARTGASQKRAAARLQRDIRETPHHGTDQKGV